MNLKTLFLLVLVALMLIYILPGENNNPAAVLNLLQNPNDGYVVYLRGEDALSLDPAEAADKSSGAIITNIYEGLVKLSPEGDKVEPCLATKWEVSEDGLTWTFQLRPGVTFHDGTPLDAEAVKHSVQRVLSSSPPGPYTQFVYGMVKEVQAPDSLRVSFVLNYPYAPFAYNLAMPYAAPVVSRAASEKYGPELSLHPAGTGPFKISQWTPQGEIRLDAYDDYWGQKPAVKGIVVKTEPDGSKRLEALERGMADLVDLDWSAGGKAVEDKKFNILETSGVDLSYLGFYTDKKPLDNPSLRRAIVQALNVEELTNSIYGGKLVPARGLLPPGMLGYDQELNPNPYDPEGAKGYLEGAGFSQGLDLTLITYSDPRPYSPMGGEPPAVQIKDRLAAVGIRLAVKVYPWNEYKSALLRRDGHLFLYGWTSDNHDPDNILFTLFYSGQTSTSLNTTHYRNREVDNILLQAQRTGDPQFRHQLYKNAQRMILSDSPLLVLNHSSHRLAHNPNIHGLAFSPGGLPRFHNISVSTDTKG